jgi:transcriptional regulator with XRE-family HTH domain
MTSTRMLSADDPVAGMIDAMGDEHNFIQQMISLRRQRGLSQRQLAKLVGTHQPSISRLEAGHIGSLAFLQKVARALDASLEIRFVPRQVTAARRSRPKSTS